MIQNDNKKALKSGIWYIISSFLLKSISFITIPIFTRLLTQDEFGQYNNFTSWLQIMTIFITLNVQSSLISAKFDYEKKFDKYILSIFSLTAINSILWAIVINIKSSFFVSFSNIDIYYINCMLVYLFFYSAFNLFQIRERFLFKYKMSVFLSVFNAIATSLLSVILVIFMQNKIGGRILGSIIPTIIIGIFVIAYLIKKGKGIDFSSWKYALKICIPYIPHALSLILLSSMDRIMITKICGAEATALYSLAYSCGLIITLLITSLNDAYSPWLGEKLHEKKYDEINSFSKKYISFFLYFAFGISLLIPEVLYILGGKEYLEAKTVLIPVALGCIFQFLYTMFVNIEQYQKKTLPMAFATVSAAILNYILNYIFINKFGYIAAAYTTAIGYIWLLIIHMIIVKIIGYKMVYNYKFITYVVIGAILVASLLNLIYLNNIVRYIILLTYISITLYILCKYKKEILSVIKSLKEKEDIK